MHARTRTHSTAITTSQCAQVRIKRHFDSHRHTHTHSQLSFVYKFCWGSRSRHLTRLHTHTLTHATPTKTKRERGRGRWRVRVRARESAHTRERAYTCVWPYVWPPLLSALGSLRLSNARAERRRAASAADSVKIAGKMMWGENGKN